MKAVEVVLFPPLVLPADTVIPEVVLLWLDTALMLVLVKLISGSLEVDTVVDEIELDVFWAEVEVVTCVSDVGAEDDVEREFAGMFLLVLCVSVTLAARVVVLEVDDTIV